MTIIIDPGDREPLPGPFQVRVIVRGADTNGVMASIEEVLAPRTFNSPHTHSNDVWVRVLEGEVGVLVGDEVAQAGPGQWALKPREVPHAMWNASDSPARIMEILTPAGSEEWFEELAQLDPADPHAFDSACRRHGIAFHHDSPWTSRLKHQFGL